MSNDSSFIQKYLDLQKTSTTLLNDAQSIKIRPWHILLRKPYKDIEDRTSLLWREVIDLDSQFYSQYSLPTKVSTGTLADIQISIVTAIRSTVITAITETRTTNSSNDNLLNFTLTTFIALVAIFISA
jgi:hypothetical protein